MMTTCPSGENASASHVRVVLALRTMSAAPPKSWIVMLPTFPFAPTVS